MSLNREPEFSYERLCLLDQQLKTEYPFVKSETVGRSLMGRKLKAFSLGERENAIFVAVVHGAERVGGAILMRYLFEKAAAFARGAFSGGFVAIPMLNPDGAAISLGDVDHHHRPLLKKHLSSLPRWQANARGVDLNHNFDANFFNVKKREIAMGYLCPGPTRFGGAYPESEPETKALADLCRRYAFSCCAALHSQGREIYADDATAALSTELASLSGYRLSEPEPIAVGGGFKDWFSLKFHRPAFTFEIGVGENPLPPAAAQDDYEQVKKMLDRLCGA